MANYLTSAYYERQGSQLSQSVLRYILLGDS